MVTLSNCECDNVTSSGMSVSNNRSSGLCTDGYGGHIASYYVLSLVMDKTESNGSQ